VSDIVVDSTYRYISQFLPRINLISLALIQKYRKTGTTPITENLYRCFSSLLERQKCMNSCQSCIVQIKAARSVRTKFN
jgi:hypothetical protein